MKGRIEGIKVGNNLGEVFSENSGVVSLDFFVVIHSQKKSHTLLNRNLLTSEKPVP